VQGTSGTTGKPTAFGISKGDMERIAEAHARFMWGFGMRQDDIVFIGSFFSLYWGSWGVLAGSERLGATAFPFQSFMGHLLTAFTWLKRPRERAWTQKRILVSGFSFSQVSLAQVSHQPRNGLKRSMEEYV
jgi:hypothetical protein